MDNHDEKSQRHEEQEYDDSHREEDKESHRIELGDSVLANKIEAVVNVAIDKKVPRWIRYTLIILLVLGGIDLPVNIIDFFHNESPIISRECAEHLIQTELDGHITELRIECNEAFIFLINRLQRHLRADEEFREAAKEEVTGGD